MSKTEPFNKSSKTSSNGHNYYDIENQKNLGADSNKTIYEKNENDDEIDNNFNVFKIICFGMAGLPYHLMFSAISVYSAKFLLDFAKIPPRYTSIILFISRAVDAITDPIYGHLLNISPITRFGKMKPWIAFSLPLTVIVYLLLWYKPEGFNETGYIIWFCINFSLFFTFITGYRIPHTSMTMYLTKSKRKRELATVCRMSCEMIGILSSLILQGFIIGDASENCERLPSTTLANRTTTNFFDEFTSTNNIFETTTVTNPIDKTTTLFIETTPNVIDSTSILIEDINSVFDDSSNIIIKNLVSSRSGFIDFFKSQKYFSAALIVSIIFVIAQSLLLITVTENKELHDETKNLKKSNSMSNNINSESDKSDFRLVITFKPFLLLACAAVSTTTSVQIVQGYFQLYFEYAYTSAKDYFTYAILVLLALSILTVPVWKIIMNKYGKKPTYIVGNTLMLPFLIGSFFFNEDYHIYIFFPLAVIAANTITCSFLLPWSMLPECMDQFYLTYNRKADALFYTFFVIGTKITISVYLGIGQYVLELGGYLNNVCADDQPQEVDLVLRLLFAPIPMTLLILSSICVFFYPINKQKVEQNAILLKNLSDKTVSNEQINSSRVDYTRYNPSFVDDESYDGFTASNYNSLNQGETVVDKSGVVVTRF